MELCNGMIEIKGSTILGATSHPDGPWVSLEKGDQSEAVHTGGLRSCILNCLDFSAVL